VAQQYTLPRGTNPAALNVPKTPVMAQPPVPMPATRGDPRGLTAFIRETAAKYGVSPEVALRVAKSEGLAQFKSGVIRKDGTEEPSFGAFQLYTGGGLGNQFQKDTGLDPADPANEKATIDYALKQASQGGWGPWNGAKRAGIGQYEGIGAGPGGAGKTADFYSGDPVPDDSTKTAKKDDEDTTAKDEKKKNKYSDALGEGLENVGKAYASGAKNANQASGPSTIAPPMLPQPMNPIPTMDPRVADARRQQLAFAMQRLNSGRLG
jgi:hypothetical protein